MRVDLSYKAANVSRNAHILYKAQSDQKVVLKVDKDGNLQRVGALGRFFTQIADLVTWGRFSTERALDVVGASQRVLKELNQHVSEVEKKIDDGNPDTTNPDVKLKIESAISIIPPRPFSLRKTAATYEPMYDIDPSKLEVYDLLKNRQTSITATVGVQESSVKASDSSTKTPEVEKAQLHLTAIRIASKINLVPTDLLNENRTPDLSSLSPVDSKVYDRILAAQSIISAWEREQKTKGL